MPAPSENRRNGALWLAFLLAVGSMLCNLALLAGPPGRRALVWLSLLLAAVALIFLARGLQRTFRQTVGRRRRILSVVLSLISLLLVGTTIFAFVSARAMPGSAGAPQVGQKVPEFRLADISGQQVSLDQLFVPARGDPPGTAPKAVLLIFYRGYW
jgi:hypothetical protein